MAYGLRALRRIQFTDETTAGTAVATTTAIWRGTGLLTDARVIKDVPEDLGSLQKQNRKYQPQVGATIKLDKTPATFEQLPYIFAMGIDDDANTGTVDGTGGSDYIYTATLPTTSTNTPKSFTFEVGDNVRADEAAYVFCSEFTLSGAKNDAVMMEATLMGRQATDCEFSATITTPTVEEILFNKGALYLHTSTFGSGQITGSFIGFTLNVKTGFQPVFTGDGNVYFYTVKQVAPVVTGTLVLEHDDNGEDELNHARSEDTRFMRLTFQGSAQTTAGSGSAWSYKTLQVDLGIVYTAVPTMEEQEGDNVITLPFEMVNVTSGGVLTCVNELSALP